MGQQKPDRPTCRTDAIPVLIGAVVGGIAGFAGLPLWETAALGGTAALGWSAWWLTPILRANSAFRQLRYSDSLRLCETALKRKSNSYTAMITASAACLGLNRPQEALDYCDRALPLSVLKANQASLYNNRSAAYLSLGKAKQAIEEATKAIAIKPQANAYSNRSRAKTILYRYEDAKADAQAALKIDPEHQPSHFALACANLGLNKLDESVADCHRLLESFSKASRHPSLVSGALIIKAAVASRRGHHDEAINESTQAIELSPEAAGLFYARANCYLASHQLEKATMDLDLADNFEMIDLVKALLKSSRARVKLLQGDLESALMLANEAVSLFESPNAFCTRAIILIRSGKLEDAAQDLARAAELCPLTPEIYWFRSELHKANGNEEQAESDRKHALTLDFIPFL